MVVQSISIGVITKNHTDFISLSDIARHKNPLRGDYIVANWLRNRNTLEFLGLWERIHNSNFNSIEFDGLKNQAGLNSFMLSPKTWIKKTQAMGIISQSGRGGGTYAQKDIAFEFASWISSEFKLYLIKEFQRLKEQEQAMLSRDWNLKRELTKINYRIHTDAIKEKLIPRKLTNAQTRMIYGSEADVLNMALFGTTAKDWRTYNKKKGNMRDFATIPQLIILANLEALNSVFIRDGLTQQERLHKLNETAIVQMKSLFSNRQIKELQSK